MTRSASPGPRDDGGVVVWPLELNPFIVGVLTVSLVAMVVAFVAVWADPATGPRERWTLVAFHSALAALFAGLVVPTRYELDLDGLRVRAGLARYRVAWTDVVRLEVTWSLLSSTTAAWTMRRVRLVTERGRVLEVGPRDRLGFVAEVLARAPQLVVDPGVARGRAWHDPARDRRRWP
jgi:hypothetical protein